MTCHRCGGPTAELRVSGNRYFYRCKACGEEGSHVIDQSAEVEDFTGLGHVIEMLADTVAENGNTTVLLVCYAARCPVFEFSSNQPLTDMGLIGDRGVVTPLGKAVARELIRRDPEARDPAR